MMNQAQANRACERCRARRVKCDRRLPGCQRCSRRGQQCSGYPSRKTFFDDGAKIRKKLKKADEGLMSSTSHPQSIISGINEASDLHDQTDRTTTAIEHPLPDHQTSFAMLLGDFDHNFLDDDIVLDPLDGDNFFDLDLETYYANGNNACGFIPGVPAILSDVDECVLNDLNGSKPWPNHQIRSKSAPLDSGAHDADKVVERDPSQETASLLCHFVEVVAPLMDIYDTNAYFGRIVPLKAASSTMLRSAIAAVAAKRIALRVQQGFPPVDRTESQTPTLSSYSTPGDAGSSQWFYKAASHYDKGLAYVRIQLQQISTVQTANLSSLDVDSNITMSDSYSLTNNPMTNCLSPQDVRAAQMEDLLTTISILTLYEDFDSSSASLSQHLDGLKSLFAQSIPYFGTKSNTPLAVFDSRHGVHAAFWYCAHQDIHSAYTTRSPTRLDPKDVRLWNASGLYPSLISASLRATVEERLQYFDPRWCENEHSASQSVIWLTLKVIDFITPRECDSASDTSTHLQETMPTSTISPNRSSRQNSGQHRSQEWALLQNLLQEWYNNLPITFKPYASISLGSKAEKEDPSFEKIFFSMPMVAAAMQMYHFAQILLLLNRPLDQESSLNPNKRLKIFHQTCQSTTYHGRQICGIALGNPHLSVKKQMIPSLHLSGLCFDKKSDRQVVLDILRDINTETSLSTERQVRELCSEWDWSTVQHD